VHGRLVPVTSIDDIIQPGQPIPDDVIAVRDPTLDTWCQQDDGLWDAFVGDTDELLRCARSTRRSR
jgi:hypothetical protein